VNRDGAQALCAFHTLTMIAAADNPLAQQESDRASTRGLRETGLTLTGMV